MVPSARDVGGPRARVLIVPLPGRTAMPCNKLIGFTSAPTGPARDNPARPPALGGPRRSGSLPQGWSTWCPPRFWPAAAPDCVIL